MEEDRTFFCSELIAKAYKVLGVIEDDDKSCAKFYPGCFSSKNNNTLRFKPGMNLESELNIIIDLPKNSFKASDGKSTPGSLCGESDETYSPVNKSTSASSGQNSKSPF